MASSLLRFFDWCYRHGAKSAEELDYVPIPLKVVELVEATWDQDVRSGGKPVPSLTAPSPSVSQGSPPVPAAATPPLPAVSSHIRHAPAAPRTNRGDLAFRWLAAACAWVVIAAVLGILFELVRNSQLSLEKFGWSFLTSEAWNPVTEDYGAASSIFGTLVSTAIAMLLAVPLSLVTALFLVDLAPPGLSRFVGMALELLAAIPSIIYGMWGLFVFAPFMANYVQPFLAETLGKLPLLERFFRPPMIGVGMLTGGIILALMILPYICAVSRDVFRMTPPDSEGIGLRHGSYHLGSDPAGDDSLRFARHRGGHVPGTEPRHWRDHGHHVRDRQRP